MNGVLPVWMKRSLRVLSWKFKIDSVAPLHLVCLLFSSLALLSGLNWFLMNEKRVKIVPFDVTSVRCFLRGLFVKFLMVYSSHLSLKRFFWVR